jgi:DNA-binding LytR/AlgR family response regulator
MKINCIIIEDEPLVRIKLTEFIQKVNFLVLLAEFNNGIDAINFLKEHSVDLIFLDIQMKDFDGIQFLNTVTSKSRIIITSAYSQYALKGYEHNVSDYLLKPFGLERFLKAVDKVTNELIPLQPQSQDHSFVFVKTEYRIERIDLNDIFYIEGMKDYLAVITKDKKIMTLMSFKSIMELLPESRFVRVHKSFIVAIDKITSIERSRIIVKEKLLPISDTYKDDFFDLLKNKKHII